MNMTGAIYPVAVKAERDPRSAKPVVTDAELTGALFTTRDEFSIRLNRERLLEVLSQKELRRFCDVLAPGGTWRRGELRDAKRLIGKVVPSLPVLTADERRAERGRLIEEAAAAASGEPQPVNLAYGDLLDDLAGGRVMYGDLATLAALVAVFATGRVDPQAAAAGTVWFEGLELVVRSGSPGQGFWRDLGANRALAEGFPAVVARLEQAGWVAVDRSDGLRIRPGAKLAAAGGGR